MWLGGHTMTTYTVIAFFFFHQVYDLAQALKWIHGSGFVQ